MGRPSAPTTPRLDSRDDPETQLLRKDVLRELAKIHKRITELSTSIGTDVTGLEDSPFVTYVATANLTAARVLVDGSNTTVNTSVAGEIAIDAPAAGIQVEDVDEAPSVASVAQLRFDSADGLVVSSPAAFIARVDLVNVPTSALALDAASIVTLAATGAMTNERALTPGHALDLTDGGAGGNATLDVVDAEIGLPLTDHVVYEVDFSTLANNTFANGTETIDGRNWTVFSAAAAGTFDILNGTGIRWIPAVSTAGVFNETTQSAAGLYIDLATLIGATYHPGKRYSFELYYSSRTLNTSSRVGPFLWAPANAPSGTAARVRGGGVNNAAGTNVTFSQQQSTATSGTEDVAADEVFGITIEAHGFVSASSGSWGGDWPVLTQRVFSTTQYTAPSGLNRGDTRFVISHSHNSQNPVVDTVVLARLRVVEL